MRTDPITDDEWRRIRSSLAPALAKLSYGSDEYRERTERTMGAAFDLLWATGCHVSVLTQPEAHELSLKETPTGSVAQWRRPKTRNWCLMPITTQEASTLQSWLSLTKRPGRKHVWDVMGQAARHAGLPGVTPLTIRHTVAFRVFRAAGPAAAKESLAVGDRALQHYTALSAGPRIAAIRAAREATNHA